MPGREADALARELIEARGFGTRSGIRWARLGLEVHEAPASPKRTPSRSPRIV